MIQPIAILIFACWTTVVVADPVLDAYIREALDNNPSYAAALDRVQSYDDRIPQAGALPDPMIGLSLNNIPVDSWSLREEPMTSKGVMLSQSFPFPGTRKLERNMARRERDMQAADAEELRLSLAQQVRESYYRWAATREIISVTVQMQSVMNQMTEVALAAYRVGKGTQQNVLRAQNESLMLDDRLLQLLQNEQIEQNRLRTLLNRSLNSDLSVPSELDSAITLLPLDSLMGRMLANNPELGRLESRLEAARLNERVANKQNFPMFTVGASYMLRESAPNGMSRSDMASLQVGTSLPIFQGSKQNRLRSQRKIETQTVESEQLDVSNRLKNAMSDLYSSQQRFQLQSDLYGSAIVPQSRQVLDAALADYQVGRGDFDAIISSQRDLLKNQEMLVERRKGLSITRSQIQMLIGRPLNEGN